MEVILADKVTDIIYEKLGTCNCIFIGLVKLGTADIFKLARIEIKLIFRDLSRIYHIYNFIVLSALLACAAHRYKYYGEYKYKRNADIKQKVFKIFLHGILLLFLVNLSFKNAQIRQVAVFFCIVKSVSDNEFIGHYCTYVICCDVGCSAAGLIEEGANLNTCGASL